MGSNYLSSFVKAELVKQGRTFTVDNFPIFFNSISTVQAEIARGEIGKITVTLTPTYEDGIKILRSGILSFGNSQSFPEEDNNEITATNIDGGTTSSVATNQQPNNVLKYLANVTTMRLKFVRPLDDVLEQETPWFVVALAQPSFEISGSELNIVLNGYSYGSLLGGPDVETNIKEQTSVYDLVTSLAGIANITLEFVGNVEAEMRAVSLLPEIRKESALDMIRWALLQVNADFILGANTLEGEESDKTGTKMIIKKNTDITKQIPKYNFIQWRNPNPTADIPEIPAFNFNLVSGQGLFINGMAFGMYRQGDDAFKKVIISPEVVKPEEEINNSTTNSRLLIANDDFEIKLGFSVPIRSENQSEAEATERTAKTDLTYNRQAYQEMTFDVMGVPNLFPMDMARFSLADIKELSGDLIVTKVTHSWGAGGWETQVTGKLSGGLDVG